MHFIAEPISPQRLQRFHRWALLWLAWFAAFLEGAAAYAPLSRQARAIGHGWLCRIERVVIGVVAMRAARRIVRPAPRKGVAEHRRKECGFSRALCGSAMRRLLRSKDLRERIARLSQNLDALVERLLRRLPCGLTRRRPILTQREERAPEAVEACAPPALVCDSS